jgi:carbon monoxide dehydrogenase subunit G
LSFLLGCVPGGESATIDAAAGTATCVLHPGLSFARGTLDLTVRRTDVIPEQSLRLNLATKGIGTTSTVEVALTFVPTEAGSRVDWRVAVTQLGGLLKAVPRGLLTAAAQKVIADAWTLVEAKMNG